MAETLSPPLGPDGTQASFNPAEDTIMIDPDDTGTEANEEASEMEEAQKDAAEEREENGGYQ